MKEREVAIALGFESGRDDAPRVLAAGYGHIAKQIMAVARKRAFISMKMKTWPGSWLRFRLATKYRRRPISLWRRSWLSSTGQTGY